MRRPVALLALLLAAPAWLPDPAVAEPVPTTQVVLRNFGFVPREIAVPVGAEVTFTNEDSGPDGIHGVTSEPGDNATFDEDPIPPREFGPAGLNSARVTFDRAGTVRYHCNHHPNMRGVVRVVEPAAHAEVRVEAVDAQAFTPDLVRVNLSQPIRWTNPGHVAHDVTFEDPAVPDLGNLTPGEILTASLAAPGAYRYRCTRHSLDFETGMVGKVAAGDDPGPFPPRVRIAQPANGSLVRGLVNVTGFAEAGIGGGVATSIEVRIGPDGDWAPTDQIDYNETLVVWQYAWNASSRAPGPVTVFARALHGATRWLEPTSIDVFVDAGPAPPDPPAPTGHRTPAPGAAALLLVALAASAARRRT